MKTLLNHRFFQSILGTFVLLLLFPTVGFSQDPCVTNPRHLPPECQELWTGLEDGSIKFTWKDNGWGPAEYKFTLTDWAGTNTYCGGSWESSSVTSKTCSNLPSWEYFEVTLYYRSTAGQPPNMGPARHFYYKY